MTARGPERGGTADRLKSWLLYPLPHHGISRLVHRLTRWRWPPFKSALINTFRRIYGIDLGDAEVRNPREFAHFNAFFTRALTPEARPLPVEQDALICPADGTLSALGRLDGDRLLQAKGRGYCLRALLGDDAEWSATLAGGEFLTIYLAPRDYHRVHMPVAGRLSHMIHIPGRLFSVAPHTVRAVPGLFTRNERIVSAFHGWPGRFALILVGAICVGSIETVWAGEITPPAGRRLQRSDYGGKGIALARGAEMGRFNMGSTVIAVFPRGTVAWDDSLMPGRRVVMGQALGRLMANRVDGNDY